MTIDEALIQLRSPDAAMRRQAVIEVGKSKNPSMLPVLAEIYRGDPDAEVRAMALKAGQYIRANMGPSAPSDPAPAAASAPPTLISSTPAPIAVVSEANRERAAGFVSQALDNQMRGNILKASELLGRAFDLNPGLANDPLAQNLAADLTGLGPTAAARTFTDRNARAQFIASKGGRAVTVATDGAIKGGETTWGGAIIDLLIYGLAAGALAFIFIMVGAKPLTDFMVQIQQAASTTQTTPAQQLQMQQLNRQIQMLSSATTVAAALPIAITFALSAVVGLVIEAGLEHLIVKSAMGGSGMLTTLIHRLAFLQIVFIALGGIAAFLFVFALLPSFSQAAARSNASPDLSVFWALWLFVMVLVVGSLYFRARIIARTYSVTWFRGCATMILYGIVLAVLQFCLSATVGGLLGNLLSGTRTGSTF